MPPPPCLLPFLSLLGASGETHNIIFVDESTLPKNRKDRLEVIRHMYSHANFCMSGDNTLPAAIAAIRDVSEI
jgi:hypothetical protein